MSLADTTPSWVTDHAHRAPEGRPWERCTLCHLAEAAHARSKKPYQPSPFTPVTWTPITNFDGTTDPF